MAQFYKIIPIYVCLLLTLPATGYAVAQENRNITGRLVDAGNGEPLGYATVVAMDSKGVQRASAISYPDGRFSVNLPKKGAYTLWFTFVGYQSHSMKITYDYKGINIGKITLEAGVEMKSVEVKAKQLVRRESDRLVYDVASDPDAKRMKMMEIMGKVPELEMSAANKGKLQYQEKPVTKIFIDDREHGMINASRQYPMNFIQASYMSKIELVLPGSPEYNNTEPILLITLAAPLPHGFSGQIDADASTRGDYKAGIDAVANTPWTGIGVRYGFDYTDAPKLSNRTLREMLDPESEYKTLDNTQTSWNTAMSHSLGMNLFRSLFNEKVDLNFAVSTSKSESDTYSDTRSQTLNAAGEEIRATSNTSSGHSDSPMRFNTGFTISQRWGKATSKTKPNYYNLKYTYKDSRSNNDQAMRYAATGAPDEDRNVVATNGSREHNVDFKLRLADQQANRKWAVYVNAGYINRLYDNATEYLLYDPVTDEFQPEEGRFDGLNYRQQVAFVQAQFLGSLFKKKMSYSLRLHGEDLSNKGIFLSTGGSKLDYHEFNVMPAAGFSLRLKRFSIGGSYNTSVRRPNVSQLNPYVDETDPENIRTGNPHLKGEYTHRFGGSISRNFSSKWLESVSLTYGYAFTNDAIERITYVNDNNISTTTYENLGHNDQQGVNVNIRIRPARKFRLNLGGSYTSSSYEFSRGRTNTVNSFSADASTVLTLLETSLYLGCHVRPYSMSAQNRSFTMYPDMELQVSRYFKKPHLGVSVFITDLLHSSKQVKEVIGSETFTQYGYRQVTGRRFTFSVYWQFGKFKQPQAIKSEAYDTKRAGLFE